MESINNKISEKLTNEKSDLYQFNILLRFSTSSKAYSIKVPYTWTIGKLEKFIEYYFKEEVKSSLITLLLGAKKLDNSTDKLSVYLKSGQNELNQIIVSTKKSQGLSDIESDKKFWVNLLNKIIFLV